jgi:F-type H+-transporting ATPase subunit b
VSFLALNVGTLVIQLINFAVFFAVLSVVFLRPVAAAIQRRRQYINSLSADYARYQAEAQNLRKQAEGVRAAARREAEQRLSAARAQASNEVSELSTRYAQQVQGIVEDAQRTAASELQAARADEERAVRGVAEVMVNRVIPEAAG